MRHWNGLRIGDYVSYHKKVYTISKIYEKDNKRLCDLFSVNDKSHLTEINIFDCEKIND